MRTSAAFFIGLIGLVTVAKTARAEESEDGWGNGGEAGGGEAAEGESTDGAASEGGEDQQYLEGKEKKEIADPVKDPNKGLHEDPEKKYFAVGARLRWIMIPEWFIKMFGVDTMQAAKYDSGLPLISNVGIGPEFIYRKDSFDITAAIWYVGLGWNPISMKGNGESEGSWEVVENDMRGILFTADFIWSTPIRDWVAITYGAGVGLGVRWGDVTETEATQRSGYLEKCTQADINVDYGCQQGEDYGKTYDKFKAFPWIEFLAGARFKPHRNVSIYVDGGFSLGFQVGTRVQYIF
jgi:hypothetical protein